MTHDFIYLGYRWNQASIRIRIFGSPVPPFRISRSSYDKMWNVSVPKRCRLLHFKTDGKNDIFEIYVYSEHCLRDIECYRISLHVVQNHLGKLQTV